MDAHKTEIVEKLVKVLCLVLDTPDGKKMNITGMFDEKEFDKGDKLDISKKHLSLPNKDEKENNLLHFSSSSVSKPPPIKPIVPEKKKMDEEEDLFHLSSSPDIKPPPIKPSTYPKKDMKGKQDLFYFSPESGVKSPPIKPVPSESAQPPTENPTLKLFGSPPEKPVHTGSPVPSGRPAPLGLEPPGNVPNTAELEDAGPNFPPPPVTGGGRRRYKRRSVRSGAKPKKRSKKRSNKKSKRRS